MRAKQPLKITQRISTITNSFVQSILPRTVLSEEDLKALRKTLRQDEDDDLWCVYCGAKATEWDHLLPLVTARRPSGHLNVLGNLVPACGPCNHSKGSQDWRKWMQGSARNSPASRSVRYIEERIERLTNYSKLLGAPNLIDPTTLYDSEKYATYWTKLDETERLMREAQVLADELRACAEGKLHYPTHRQIPAGT